MTLSFFIFVQFSGSQILSSRCEKYCHISVRFFCHSIALESYCEAAEGRDREGSNVSKISKSDTLFAKNIVV